MPLVAFFLSSNFVFFCGFCELSVN